MLYLTFVGNHDQIIPGQSFGAALKIFLEYKNSIEQVFIFVTPTKKSNGVNYREIAKQNQSVMLAENPGLQITLLDIDLPNPVNFDLVYPVMLDATQRILEDNQLKSAEKIINITSGTPTMTTCWVLLQKSGLIPNAKLVQSFETKYARNRGRSTQEVNLEIDDFPQISAPPVLKRKLTILRREKEQLSEKLKVAEIDQKIPELIGQSNAIREIKEQILYDINDSTHVLITGERGTGKQVVAEAIWRLYHHENDTHLKTFDCGTFPRELVTAELFGYLKGAFTGAVETREGILKECHQRMLFLDEIGNLPMEGQNALLRYLSNGEIRKIGSREVEYVETQILAATNKNINDSTLFAQDLKDRFDEILNIPPLRSRREDIGVLIHYFLARYSQKPLLLHSEITKKLVEYDWPGNVRELEKWIQRIVRRFPEGGEIRLKNLPDNFIQQILSEEDTNDILPELPLSVPLDQYIERIKEKARKMAQGKMAEVDRLLNQKTGTEKQRQYRLRKM